VPTVQGWLSVRSDVDPRVVVITFGTSDCDGAAHATATEEGKTVSVSLVVNQQSSGECDDALRLRYLTVDLRSDLAGRSVLDAFDHRRHQPFDGSTLLTPARLPAGFTLVHEQSSDSDAPNPPTVVPTPAYWVRTWSLPRTGIGTRAEPDCSAHPARAIRLGQGSGALPHWDPSQVQQVCTVRLHNTSVVLLRVTTNGDLDLSWRDATSHQNFQLDSDEECDSTPPYTVAEFTRIAESLT
jgi:hypothetical protein